MMLHILYSPSLNFQQQKIKTYEEKTAREARGKVDYSYLCCYILLV